MLKKINNIVLKTDKIKIKGWISMKRSVFSFVALCIMVILFQGFLSSGVVPAFKSQTETQFKDLGLKYEWAKPAINYIVSRGIMAGISHDEFFPEDFVTNEQLAKIIVLTFGMQPSSDEIQTFTDITSDRWSFPYIQAAKNYISVPSLKFEPTKNVTVELVLSSFARAAGLSAENMNNPNALDKFSDKDLIDPMFKDYVAMAVDAGYSENTSQTKLSPRKPVTRAEMAVIIYNTSLALGNMPQKNAVYAMKQQEYLTPIEGKPVATLAQAKSWARSKGASNKFIEAADIYWKYGEITNIRPDLLYAQSAKETAYGRYTGNVTEDMNNFAGIKIIGSSGDSKEDHESFATIDDGVRAHFNHMSAYIGKNPIGEPHPRYNLAKSSSWAGSVKYAEELGSKWAPDENYGLSIVNNFLNEMINSAEK